MVRGKKLRCVEAVHEEEVRWFLKLALNLRRVEADREKEVRCSLKVCAELASCQ